MKFDHSKLSGRIAEKFKTQDALANRLGWMPSKLSRRMTNEVQFGTDEIMTLCAPDCLDIAPQEIPLYFFEPEF